MIADKYINNVLKNPMISLFKEETEGSVIKRNNQFWASTCPFCGGKMTMNLRDNEYYCYSCGQGGNIIDFIMRLHSTTFVEAVQYIASQEHMIMPEIPDKKTVVISEKVASIMEINKIAARYYFEQLRRPNGLKGMDYFNNRQVPEKIKNIFGLGYAGHFGDNLYRLLKSKGYSESAILESGLVAKSNKTNAKNPFYDKFWDRVIFPIFNQDGDVVAFGGRVLDDSKPKYLNSPETAAYIKGDNLFASDKAKYSKHNYYICCEGYMDAIAMHQYGFDCAVASLGTALTRNQIKLLSSKDEVILSYDSDAPGIAATKRAILLCREAGVSARVLNIENAKDPDEFLKKFGAQAFATLIQNAETASHFMIRNSKTSDGNYNFDLAVEELF